MFNGDDITSTLIKAAAMLLIVLAEYWAMQPYHEPLLARIWYVIAGFCYRTAYRFGSIGLKAEHYYYEAMA